MCRNLAREAEIIERVRGLTGRVLEGPLKVVDDTTEFMSIERDQVVDLEGELFLVTGTEREKRFGLAGEPKFWVKRALSLGTGTRHILKMVFAETFRAEVGAERFVCTRSAEKEARVLDLVRGDGRFMQGRAVRDARGNLVRVIDFIEGTDLLSHLSAFSVPHEEYFRTVFPGVLARVIESLEAIDKLHRAGLCHGDIRNDHLLVDGSTGTLRWIDFDLDQESPAFDVWSAGNILHFTVARRIVRLKEVLRERPELQGVLSSDDASVFFPYRLMNLGKLHPHLPRPLNDVLLRFSVGGKARYRSVAEVVQDLGALSATLRAT